HGPTRGGGAGRVPRPALPRARREALPPGRPPEGHAARRGADRGARRLPVARHERPHHVPRAARGVGGPRRRPRAARRRARGAGPGLRLLVLPHDQHLLTVHLDGAPVARCLARGLGSGAALAPLPELLLQVLEHPAPPAGLLPLHEGLERASPVRTAQLAERLGLDLPNALAGHREALPDLLEGVVGLLADAEAQPQDLLLAARKRGV